MLEDIYHLFVFVFVFYRGVSINVLRHEAEFYGITPLGMCCLIVCIYDLAFRIANLPPEMDFIPGPIFGWMSSVCFLHFVVSHSK